MYRVGICDDDKVFCAGLEEIICELAKELCRQIETEVWYSGESLMRDLEKMLCPDILFLDIELYEKSGIDVGKFIRADREDYLTHIVYVSSREEYAMQLFKLQPLDFLVKPVSKEQVREVLLRSFKQKAQGRELFEYRKGGHFYQVPCSEILYFMSNDKKISLVIRDGRQRLCRRTAGGEASREQNDCGTDRIGIQEFYGKLKTVMTKLPAGFVMIHQSYIINSEFVAEYTYETVTMQDGSVLGISRPYRKAVRSRIKELKRERLHVGI